MDNLAKQIAQLEWEIEEKIKILSKLKEEMIILLRHDSITPMISAQFISTKASTASLSTLLINQNSSKNAIDNENEDWKSLVANSYNSCESRIRDSDKYWRKKQIALKFMDSWMERLKNVQKTPEIITRFSLFLWYHGCTQPIWKVLSRLRLSFSYNKTKALLNQSITISVPKQLGWISHNTIFVVGADNCAYYNAHTYTRDNSLPLFTNTINWYIRYWNSQPQHQMSIEDDTFARDFIDNKESFRYY